MNDFFRDNFSLQGKTALVTGGAKGIGAMITQAFLQAGARVIVSSRSAEDCSKAAEEFSDLGECIALPQDLSTVENITALAADIEQLGHGLDILVNNSGRTWGAPLEEFPESGWDSVMDLNVKSPFFLVQKCLPLLTKSASADNRARIINIGSIAGLSNETLMAYSYGPSKAAILHMTGALARDLASRNINVNAIAPGLFDTRMVSHIKRDEALQKEVMKTIPMGRAGQAEDIGGLAVFLCSRASAFMTGSIIPVDGGQLVAR